MIVDEVEASIPGRGSDKSALEIYIDSKGNYYTWTEKGAKVWNHEARTASRWEGGGVEPECW